MRWLQPGGFHTAATILRGVARLPARLAHTGRWRRDCPPGCPWHRHCPSARGPLPWTVLILHHGLPEHPPELIPELRGAEKFQDRLPGRPGHLLPHDPLEGGLKPRGGLIQHSGPRRQGHSSFPSFCGVPEPPLLQRLTPLTLKFCGGTGGDKLERRFRLNVLDRPIRVFTPRPRLSPSPTTPSHPPCLIVPSRIREEISAGHPPTSRFSSQGAPFETPPVLGPPQGGHPRSRTASFEDRAATMQTREATRPKGRPTPP